jgi:tetratricopeptide (TPR) repeat protein
MKKNFLTFLVISLLFLIMPVQVLGSKPWDKIIVGCVIDGMLFEIGDSLPVKRAFMLTVVPPLNLTPYEGKKIRLRGKLTPGDRLQPDIKDGIKVLGVCDQEVLAVVRKELPQAYRTRAEDMAENDDWSNAWKNINKAIKLDSSDCSLYLTRAKFYESQGKFAEAVVDVQRAVQHGCDNYAHWALLAELLEKVGQKSAAIDAYERAVRVCEYKPDREKFQHKIDQLKGTTPKTPKK